MTDSTLAVFFNSPPQVAISEMFGDLPCGEKLFEAESALAFERIALQELPEMPGPTLSDLVPSLLFPLASERPAPTTEHITATNLLMLVCGMQTSYNG